ncbi:hypothetical protein [Paenibacillus sp. FSL R7-0331]|uniref:hypothetical protein n=1 Tax=Paenibacillus sp. FSL R7-0331 TaxID=1536773 RepID=UPI0004F83595|nr:hypothetical protein [Paenibacillus sp. FSL R7-0331]AIQ52454.1 hypothetical protein R70331_13660 [Paenibacillus sp. FSL R7-0331]
MDEGGSCPGTVFCIYRINHLQLILDEAKYWLVKFMQQKSPSCVFCVKITTGAFIEIRMAEQTEMEEMGE